jgi:hypothetical protein
MIPGHDVTGVGAAPRFLTLRLPNASQEYEVKWDTFIFLKKIHQPFDFNATPGMVFK